MEDSVLYFKRLAEDGNNLVHGVQMKEGYSLRITDTHGEFLDASWDAKLKISDGNLILPCCSTL